ncbi:hypothetical protein PPTG_10525 [Phytophthora nicotianae INRA-310]|uniref:Reverse transcriptase zinc-binding domain-containing protein n=1 Tax=Phytophthora nicotianae (strain INRA-310) TaxID=761204 RepID=W2QB61_PHYN3|nr:hypothetical protein PPTG_10525 [Phytophthora nicotianae INRA-310]ETN10387.1 hypothetical protein PPTG_10525 [Phytophthora nicotianae INRA-310]
MGIPFSAETGHSQPKLRRWGIAILTSIPTLTVGSTLRVGTVATLRHPPELRNNYTWIIINAHRIRGVSSTSPEESTFELEQQPNGIHWMISESTQADATTKADIVQLQQHEYTGAIVFQAHPMLHGFPWTVPDSTANRHVLAAIKKQAFKRYCGDGIKLDATVNHLQQAVQTSTWQAAAMTQSPKQLWAHTNELTAYQVWVSYRVALRQLNLYYDGRQHDNSCRKLQCCQGHKETLEHIMWDCPCAQACWQKLISHWTGEQWSLQTTKRFQEACASRKAPVLSRVIKAQLGRDHPDEETQYAKEWKRMWRILCSICMTSLWIQRNRVVFQQEEITVDRSVLEFWTTSQQQLRGIAKRERRKPETMEIGTRLLLCQRQMEKIPTEKSPKETSPVQPPDQTLEPALLARLRIKQTSSRR